MCPINVVVSYTSCLCHMALPVSSRAVYRPVAERCACTSFRLGLHTMFLPYVGRRQSCGAVSWPLRGRCVAVAGPLWTLEGALRMPPWANMSVGSHWPRTGPARVLRELQGPSTNRTGEQVGKVHARVGMMHPRAPHGTRRVHLRVLAIPSPKYGR